MVDEIAYPYAFKSIPLREEKSKRQESKSDLEKHAANLYLSLGFKNGLDKNTVYVGKPNSNPDLNGFAEYTL